MFNFIKYYFRSMYRRKLFSCINIFGLAFGIAFIILIGQFIYHELNYSSSIKDLDTIYRLVNDNSNNYWVDYRTRDLIIEKIPEVKDACVMNRFGIDLNANKKLFQITDMLVVNPAFFNFFNVQFIHGNATEALSTVDAVVLTETTAKRLFGTANAVGKTVQLAHEFDMIVTGIVKDLPNNLSFAAQIFVSYENTPKERIMYRQSCAWTDGKDFSQCKFPFCIFIKLTEKTDIRQIEKQISAFSKINKYWYDDKISLTPMKSNYLHTEIKDGDLLHGNPDLIKLLAIIGVIILLLAVINFVNLATAAYKYRLTEISIKKCFGAGRKNLIRQLLAESLLTCFIASSFAIIFAEIFLPYFNQFIDKSLSLQILNNLSFFAMFISFLLVLGILTGLFPAMILSRISPLQIFRLNPSGGGGKSARGVLCIIQFSIATILITGLIVINRQIDFIKHKDLGFSTEQLLYIKTHYTLGSRLNLVTDKLRQFHNVKSLTMTMGIPGELNVMCDNHDAMIIDSTSLSTFGFKIVKGRNLLPGDINKACLVNETAFRKLSDGDFTKYKINNSEIVGVVSDFNYSSLYIKPSPLVLLYSPAWGFTHITIRIAGNVRETLDYIEKIWKENLPDYQLEYGFYDEHFAAMYKKEENLAALVNIFSILAIIISCMGIFGLAVFQSEQKIKEIGIRKVLGATTPEIIYLLTKSFSKWVIIANVFAIPAAYYFLNKWLQDFAYKIDLEVWMFALAGSIALLIAITTIMFQAIKAATANPVNSLKYE